MGTKSVVKVNVNLISFVYSRMVFISQEIFKDEQTSLLLMPLMCKCYINTATHSELFSFLIGAMYERISFF